MDDRLKKILIIIFFLITLTLGMVIYTLMSGEFKWDSIIVLIIVILFLAYIIPKYVFNKNDVVDEDEFSKKIVRLAAARSYIITLYTWLAIMWFDEPLTKIAPASSTKIGFGIGIMAIVFLVNAIIIKARGIKE